MDWTWVVYGSGLLLLCLGCGMVLRSAPAARGREAAAAQAVLERAAGLLRWREWRAVKGMVRRREQKRMDMEIYEGISLLRNLTILGKGSAVPADYILEELAQHKGLLQPVCGRTLHLLRMNRREEAEAYFARAVGTPISRDFARLLLQWDAIDPKDLLETLLSHQKNIKEIRTTAQKRKDETISDLVYLPVVLNVMLVFINFLYVGYFMDQRELLTMFL
ncbi:MAG: hypothetical protein Q4C22_05840 [Bacillota bacterium]|nr:hypothetical protein [Bacillota bacterium]